MLNNWPRGMEVEKLHDYKCQRPNGGKVLSLTLFVFYIKILEESCVTCFQRWGRGSSFTVMASFF